MQSHATAAAAHDSSAAPASGYLLEVENVRKEFPACWHSTMYSSACARAASTP